MDSNDPSGDPSRSTVADTAPSSPSETPWVAPPGYEVGAVLGRGGMGEVVLAQDTEIGRGVAIKRMRGRSPSDEAVARFLREARVQARLEHPAIVPVHEIGRDPEGQPFFTMKR